MSDCEREAIKFGIIIVGAILISFIFWLFWGLTETAQTLSEAREAKKNEERTRQLSADLWGFQIGSLKDTFDHEVRTHVERYLRQHGYEPAKPKKEKRK